MLQPATFIANGPQLKRPLLADKRAVEAKGQAIRLTASTGVCRLREETGADVSLEWADTALYRIEEGGRNPMEQVYNRTKTYTRSTRFHCKNDRDSLRG